MTSHGMKRDVKNWREDLAFFVHRETVIDEIKQSGASAWVTKLKVEMITKKKANKQHVAAGECLQHTEE